MTTATFGTRTSSGQSSNEHGFAARFGAWLTQLGARSSGARAADAYIALNASSDAELARRGLTREQLVDHCYGHLHHG